MNTFLTDDFLLKNEPARRLYHEYAETMPIFDYHCHLSPAAIADNADFRNLTRIWLGGDHYKWKAMRTNGVDERFVTGNADDFEKFMKWAETVPWTVGNPLYHWTHLELRDPFGITDMLLNPSTAKKIWDICNEKLATDAFRVRGLLEHFRVKALCTTDDPADDLSHHKKLASDSSFGVKVLPAFRPDKAYTVEEPAHFNEYMERLGEVSGVDINSFGKLLEALDKRTEYFHLNGSRLSDHALMVPVYAEASDRELENCFGRLRSGKILSEHEASAFRTAVLLALGRGYARRGWVMQLHIGALRNNNFRMMQKLGPDTGFDSIADYSGAFQLSRFLDKLDETAELPKTILYTLNPSDNAVMATMIGNFQDGSVPGKMQFGSAWWFNDQKHGMEDQMRTLSDMGLLSRFVGMVTDSRSFLSYPRHEYFRRILCNMMGTWIEDGEAPADFELLGGMVRNVCFGNASTYFGIDAGRA